MKQFFNVAAVLSCILLLSITASADSFRCGSAVVYVGDTKADVLEICGAPTHKEVVAERTIWGARRLGMSSFCGSSTTVPVEQWTYHLGSCRFSRILTFKGSTLVSIKLGEKF